ncbi:hypothetical protein K3495_g14446 [Podosphaera aphanis]|nr:hypothetical protein K3495_g14446 [Podosphaera aphanis]
MARLLSRPIDTQPIPSFVDPLRSENTSASHVQSNPALVMSLDDPVASVNAATHETICYGCGKRGHFKTNCCSKNTDQYSQQKQSYHSNSKSRHLHTPASTEKKSFHYDKSSNNIKKRSPPPPPPRRKTISTFAAKDTNLIEQQESWKSCDCEQFDSDDSCSSVNNVLNTE